MKGGAIFPPRGKRTEIFGRPFPRFSGGGFTLLEMMVVLAVVALLATLTIPTVNKVVRASNLSSSGRQFMDQCVLARQTAQAKNMPVEVRLYRLPDYNADAAASPEVYRAFQIFLVGDSNVPLTKPDFFKTPVVISPGTNESAFLADLSDSASSHKQVSPAATDPKLGVHGNNYQYAAFRFLPSGATDLVATKNFVTFVLEDDKSVAEGGNFFTVQIDPVNGSVRSFRP